MASVYRVLLYQWDAIAQNSKYGLSTNGYMDYGQTREKTSKSRQIYWPHFELGGRQIEAYVSF